MHRKGHRFYDFRVVQTGAIWTICAKTSSWREAMSRCERVVERRQKKWWCRVDVIVMESDSNLKSLDDDRELCGDFSARISKV